MIGRMDLSRAPEYIESRSDLFNYFCQSIPKGKLLLPLEFLNRKHVAFSIPIVFLKNVDLSAIIKECEDNLIETRPIISGNLLRQTCYKQFGDYKDFPNSEFLHTNGFYVGLHPKVTKAQIDSLTETINKYA
jgi:CDP-6-deoxy-D-xylo-4-hexulose-3-dehydrase